MSLEGVTVRLEPGIHGRGFVTREAQNISKPVRQALALLTANSIKDVQSFKNRKGVVFCVFDDLQHVRSFNAGTRNVQIGFVEPLPPSLGEAVLQENGPHFFDDAFMLGVAVRDSSVALVGRFYMDPHVFALATEAGRPQLRSRASRFQQNRNSTQDVTLLDESEVKGVLHHCGADSSS